MHEIKRTLDGKVVEYPAKPLLIEPGVRAVLLCRIDEPEVVAGGRMRLQPGTLSIGYFWCERPYNVYHWLYAGKTLVYYINIGRIVALRADALIWDDYAVDILAYPDGSVDVIDEDEIPDTVDDDTRDFIREATAAALAELAAIVAAVEGETRALLPGSEAMSFTAEQSEQVADLWLRMLAHPFLMQTRDGTIADVTFARWMRQDYLFVAQGVHFLAALLARAPARHRDPLAESIDALRKELVLFEEQAARAGVELSAARPAFVTHAYMQFLMATSATASYAEAYTVL